MTQMPKNSAGASAAAVVMDIDLESTHRFITALVTALQRNFKADTNYLRPLMPPQANIIFVLDKEAADHMVIYMSAKLKEAGGFEDREFRFTLKSGANGEVLQRLRLEFPDGVTTHIIRKMLVATDRLDQCINPA
jgi:hypothetical protein